MTKTAHTYRFELWEYKTLVNLSEKLGKDETATLVLAIRELALSRGIHPATPCLNMLQLKEGAIVTCKLYGDVSGKLKCLNCEKWSESSEAPLQEKALEGWQTHDSAPAPTA